MIDSESPTDSVLVIADGVLYFNLYRERNERKQKWRLYEKGPHSICLGRILNEILHLHWDGGM